MILQWQHLSSLELLLIWKDECQFQSKLCWWRQAIATTGLSMSQSQAHYYSSFWQGVCVSSLSALAWLACRATPGTSQNQNLQDTCVNCGYLCILGKNSQWSFTYDTVRDDALVEHVHSLFCYLLWALLDLHIGRHIFPGKYFILLHPPQCIFLYII